MKDNIKAFPSIETITIRGIGGIERTHHVNEGMELRDWFAGQALNGELACQDNSSFWQDIYIGRLAARCYLIADAMIKAREVKNDTE